MQYQVFARRTKSDNKDVLVAEATKPFTSQRLASLKSELAMLSLEFNDDTRLRQVVKK